MQQHFISYGLIATMENVHTRSVLAASFSPQGNLLASAGKDNTIILWNITAALSGARGEDAVYMLVSGHTDQVNSLQFSPDGCNLSSVSEDWSIKIWKIFNAKGESGHDDFELLAIPTFEDF